MWFSFFFSFFFSFDTLRSVLLGSRPVAVSVVYSLIVRLIFVELVLVTLHRRVVCRGVAPLYVCVVTRKLRVLFGVVGSRDPPRH